MTNFSRRDAIKTGGLFTISLLAAGCGSSSTPLVSPAAAQPTNDAGPAATPRTIGVYLQRGQQGTLEALGEQKYRLVIGDFVSSHFSESHPSTGARFGFESIDSFLAAYSSRFSGYDPVAVLEYRGLGGRLLDLPLRLKSPARVADGISYVATPSIVLPAGYSSLNEAVITRPPDILLQQSPGTTSLGEVHLNVATAAVSSGDSDTDFRVVSHVNVDLEGPDLWILTTGTGTLRVIADAADSGQLFLTIPSIVESAGDPFTWVLNYEGKEYRRTSGEGLRFPFAPSTALSLAVELTMGQEDLPYVASASIFAYLTTTAGLLEQTLPFRILLRDPQM